MLQLPVIFGYFIKSFCWLDSLFLWFIQPTAEKINPKATKFGLILV